MSATVHPREHGVTLRCNYADCSATHTTALIGVRRNRKAAASAGWIRGLDKGSGSTTTGGGQTAKSAMGHLPGARRRGAAPRRRAQACSGGAARRARRQAQGARRAAQARKGGVIR
jgi:hypothetical protein